MEGFEFVEKSIIFNVPAIEWHSPGPGRGQEQRSWWRCWWAKVFGLRALSLEGTNETKEDRWRYIGAADG
jgi:hypothetical protein